MGIETVTALVVAVIAIVGFIYQRSEINCLRRDAEDKRIEDRVSAVLGRRLIEIDAIAQESKDLVESTHKVIDHLTETTILRLENIVESSE